MRQTIRLTESELRNMIQNAVNEALGNNDALDKELQWHFDNNETLKKDCLFIFDKLSNDVGSEWLEEKDAFIDQIFDEDYWWCEGEWQIRNCVLDFLKNRWGEGLDERAAGRLFEIWEVYIGKSGGFDAI